MTNIINLTPHDINIVGDDDSARLVIPASGQVARCKATTVVIGSVTTPDGVTIPMTATEMGEVENLPDPVDGTILIVSLAVAKAASGRDDLVVTNESVRDFTGRIVGCKSLGRV